MTTIDPEDVAQVLPWARHLPGEVRCEVMRDLIENAIGASRSGVSDDLIVQSALVGLSAWRSTAEVYADPELQVVLAGGPEDDFGPVPVPEAVR